MPDKCLDCPAPSADMDGFIVSGPGGAPRSEGSGVSSPEGPFVREAPQTGHVVIMGTLGADGNPGSLPDAPQVGWAYVAGDAGTYGGVQATEGDMVYCTSLNPVKWGVLQADSDDSGRDLVSVSASFSCSGETWVPFSPHNCMFYGYDYAGDEPVPVSVVYSVNGNSLSFEWHVDAHQHAVVVLDGIPVDVFVSGLPEAGAVFEGSSSAGSARMTLVSVTRANSRFHFVFDLAVLSSPSLSLTSVKASGASSTQTVDMSCLNGRYGALESLSASFECGAGSWQPATPYYATVNVACTFYDGTLPPVDPASSMDLPVSYGAFVFKGSDFERLTDAIHTTSDIVMSVSYGGQPLYYAASSDSFSGFFSGNVHVGAVRHFINSRMGFILESREELASQDPGGPDIVCTFRFVRGGGDFLSLTSKTAAGNSEEQIIDLSCLHADSLVDAGVYFSCDPSPAISFVYDRADGTQSSQTVDMSCLVPPVFNGSADGLVPANSPATQTADLLSDDGTWMRPATDAEIDALFVPLGPAPDPDPE